MNIESMLEELKTNVSLFRQDDQELILIVKILEELIKKK